MVQNKVYEVSDDLLRSGGLLNVIDRAEYPSTSILKDGLLDSHRDQASVTSLNVEDLEFIEYSEPETHGAIKMVLTIPEEYKGSGMEKFALTSISSRKP
jgi:hypothetical protein